VNFVDKKNFACGLGLFFLLHLVLLHFLWISFLKIFWLARLLHVLVILLLGFDFVSPLPVYF